MSRRQPCQPTGGTSAQNGGSERVNACNWRLIDRTHLTLRQLPAIEQALEAGSVVVIEPDRIRLRRLPLLP